jgi:lipopolysaccharide export system protein LptA
MGTYRLVRVLRAVLPVIVLVLIGIPARNYWKSRDRTISAEPSFTPSAADLSVHTLDLTFSRFDGRPVLRVMAKEQFYFKDNTYKLRDVNVVISGEKPGDFDRVISGDQCLYNQATGYVHFTGNVKAQLDARTSARTEELIYTPEDRVITSPVRTHIEQPGEMMGDVDELKYHIATELLHVSGNVEMHMSNGESLRTAAAEFQNKENWASVMGGVVLEASNGWLRGTSGRADLQPGTYRPVFVAFEGDVTSESHSQNSTDTLKTHSGSMTSVLTPAGAIQHIFAKTDVRADQMAQGATKTITGAEVEASLNDHGHVDTLEARQAVAPYAKMVESERNLISDTIQIKSDGNSIERSTVTTSEHSTMEAGGSIISGRAFRIDQSDKLVFETLNPASITSRTKDGLLRTTSGNTTTIDINKKTNALEKLTQTGNFTFKEGDARSGKADKGVITEGGNHVELFGNFSFKEGTRSGKAGHAVFTDNGDTVEMWESVSFTDTSRRGSAAHVKFLNGGEIIEMNSPTGQSAKVVDSEKKSEVQGRQIRMNQKTNAFEATTEVFTESKAQPETVQVYANHAKSDGDLVTYDGSVTLIRGTNSLIKADAITPQKNNGFTAEGHVDSKTEGMQVWADKLVYDDEKNTALYTGTVHAIKDDRKGKMDLRSTDMTLIIDPADPKTQKKAQLKSLTANGKLNNKVVVTQGTRRGTGDRLIYDYVTDDVILQANKGSEVTVDDPPNQTIRNATWAHWTSSGGAIDFRNEQGGKVISTSSGNPVKAK